MVKKRLVFRADVNWGWLPILITVIVLLIDVFYIYYFVKYIQVSLQIGFAWPMILTLIPILGLNALFYPVFKGLILKKLKSTEFQLYSTGIKIGKDFLNWSEIKSISFKTGRYKGHSAFFRGLKLPALQSIFVLDKEGKEYSCIIDVDYSFKKKRAKNNLRKIKDFLLGMDKLSILSDWAEKR